MKVESNFARRKTRQISVGTVPVGGDAPITVQSMTVTKTEDHEATLTQIYALFAAGADIVRCTCNRIEAAEGLARIVPRSPVPIVADIHNNHKMALAALEAGVHCLRLNPGNIRKPDQIKAVAKECADRQVPIRIGVNAGSLDPDLCDPDHGATPEALVASAMRELAYFDEVGFDLVKISVKASSVPLMIDAYRQLAETTDHPLHLGVTEAGMPPEGVIKTRIAFEQLISAGIGDTIRVSLTLPFDDKGEEIRVGRQILDDIYSGRFRSVPKLLPAGLNIISCPSCSRVENEAFIDLAHQVRELTEYARDHQLTIAIMGCRVNGPGETDDADLGLWCAPNFVNLKRGPQLIGQFPYDEVLGVLKEQVDGLIAARQ